MTARLTVTDFRGIKNFPPHYTGKGYPSYSAMHKGGVPLVDQMGLVEVTTGPDNSHEYVFKIKGKRGGYKFATLPGETPIDIVRGSYEQVLREALITHLF